MIDPDDREHPDEAQDFWERLPNLDDLMDTPLGAVVGFFGILAVVVLIGLSADACQPASDPPSPEEAEYLLDRCDSVGGPSSFQLGC